MIPTQESGLGRADRKPRLWPATAYPPRAMLVLAHLGFLIFGTILVVVGSTQSSLAGGLGIGLEGTGGLAASVSLGLGIGVVTAGPPTDRWPRRPLFVMAALVASLGLAFAAAGTNVWQVGMGLGVAGAGAGFFETILNTVVAELDPQRAERRLASVHSAATAGAVSGGQNRRGHRTNSFQRFDRRHPCYRIGLFQPRHDPPLGRGPQVAERCQ